MSGEEGGYQDLEKVSDGDLLKSGWAGRMEDAGDLDDGGL